jgi:flagellar biosynthetic protein FliQ
MGMEEIVALGRLTLETALWLCAPLLAIAMVVGLLLNLVQVLTSLQDTTLSTVPRLLAVGAAVSLLMPWMLRHLAGFTVQVLGNLRMYSR